MKSYWIVLGMWVVTGPLLWGQVPVQFSSYTVSASNTASDPSGPHGGSIHRFEQGRLETVVHDGGVDVYLYAVDGRAAPVDAARGVVHLKIGNDARRYRYDLLPREPNALSAPTDLSRTRGKQIELHVYLMGLPGTRSGAVRYRETIAIPPSRQQLAAAAIARQKVCPVTGRPLRSMGEPLPVAVGEKTVFVCCAGCVPAVRDNPDKYSSGRPTLCVSTATAEDAECIARQAVCPVMDEPLGGMGQPIKVMVGDKPIFLCCRGCIKKVEADPGGYLNKIYGREPAPIGRGGTVSLTTSAGNVALQRPHFEQAEKAIHATADRLWVGAGQNEIRQGVYQVTEEDKPFIAAQEKCPVMDTPLEAMGGPFKVHAEGHAIYICCPGCAKRIAADPRKYLHQLEGQGIQPPLLREHRRSSGRP